MGAARDSPKQQQGGRARLGILLAAALMLLLAWTGRDQTAATLSARLRLQLEGFDTSTDGAALQQEQQPAEVAEPSAAPPVVQCAPTQQQQPQEQPPPQQLQQPQQPQPEVVPEVPEGERRRALAAAVNQCITTWGGLDCLTKQKDLAPAPGQFRFPHFLLAGYQKCATTSLYHHLAKHPQVLSPSEKEPEFFTTTCAFNAMRCPKTPQRDYIWGVLKVKEVAEAKLSVAAFEGTTHYALEGRWLAPQLRQLFPWLRVVLSMRDPISQAISMVYHNIDSGREVPCYVQGNNTIFLCCQAYLNGLSRYAPSLRAWVEAFPRDQMHVLQYENLTSEAHMEGALRDVKSFLGLKPGLPSNSLGMHNARHQTQQTEGWPMTRANYEALVELARRNAMEVADIVRQHGFADADGWLANWEAAWQANLKDNCGAEPDSRCMIQLT